ncbi:hypothetical protein [Ferrimicrobium acidiphilum]|uniref:Uncharacterized protein n=1 Tax=Ferrimicrobium acidiphilum TaxID=121039 RepID=A0ABV3XYN3_9ACTN
MNAQEQRHRGLSDGFAGSADAGKGHTFRDRGKWRLLTVCARSTVTMLDVFDVLAAHEFLFSEGQGVT